MLTVRCARCDSTDDDVTEGQVTNSSPQLVDYGHPDHHQPASRDCFHQHSLEVASNGFLINISDDDLNAR